MQNLLKYKNAIAYSSGNEWLCDYYNIDGILISSGYSPVESKNTQPSYDLIKVYDDQANTIANNTKLKWTDQRDQINQLLTDLINKTINIYNSNNNRVTS